VKTSPETVATEGRGQISFWSECWKAAVVKGGQRACRVGLRYQDAQAFPVGPAHDLANQSLFGVRFNTRPGAIRSARGRECVDGCRFGACPSAALTVKKMSDTRRGGVAS
jgi:hypothetical protein